MIQQFIQDNLQANVAQLALQRNRYPMLSDSDFRFCLQQITGRQRTKEKLPLFASIEGWIYPPRLNIEQCSSERTARYKAELLAEVRNQKSEVRNQKSEVRNQKSEIRLIDGTGGYGVDTFFMSEAATETHYFEQNAELAAIAEHNFRLAGKSIVCHPEPFELSNSQTSDLLSTLNSQPSTILYLDPARRDANGGKVFRLEDCTPDVTQIVRYVRQNCPGLCVLLKLSPMLDFHQAIAQLGGVWEVYILSVDGEVKELLLQSAVSSQQSAVSAIHAVTLGDEQTDFCFTPEEEQSAQPSFIFEQRGLCSLSNAAYLYEPDAAILKAGAFKLMGARYNLMKAAPNTHLYFGTRLIPFPGRTWQVVAAYARAKEVQRVLARANVITRNYVLPADALRKQLGLKDGGDDYIIGCRIADKPQLLHCRRV